MASISEKVKKDQDFIIVGKKDIYHELGTFSFKIILSPRIFVSSHESFVEVKDSHNYLMNSEIKKWGRKMICSFTIDKNTHDGVSSIIFNLVDKNGKKIVKKITAWIVKPDED